jgi:hypothetical protein
MKIEASTLRLHGPLPWEADAKNLMVVDAYGNVVADCEVETFEVERAANAELIAAACNSHHNLLEALKRLTEVSIVVWKLNQAHSKARPEVWEELQRASRMGWVAIDEAEKRQDPM